MKKYSCKIGFLPKEFLSVLFSTETVMLLGIIFLKGTYMLSPLDKENVFKLRSIDITINTARSVEMN